MVDPGTQSSIIRLPRSYGMQPHVVRLGGNAQTPQAIYTFWFAWYAMFPDATVDQQLLSGAG